MRKFIVNAPKIYPRQSFLFCGSYCVNYVLRHFKKRKIKTCSLLETFTGHTFPSDLESTLTNKGLDAVVMTGGTINKLKQHINRKHPVIVLLRTGTGRNYRSMNPRHRIFGHWIVILGYDYDKFYVYDPYAKAEKLPVGNATLPFKELKKFWKAPLGMSWWDKLYIPVSTQDL